MAKKYKRVKLIKLLTNNGELLDQDGWSDFVNGVYDDTGNIYAAGFEEDGTVHGTDGDSETGQILHDDESDTGYNINENYFSLVCLKVIHSNFRKSA